MTIPTSSNYPDTFDSETNLYLVHDGLRVRLLEDYNPGDTSIQIEGDSESINRFPASGQITLTEQCSDTSLRALTFHYASRTSSTFDGLELLPNFTDSVKAKRITNVTQNVMADHHENIKNALIAIEQFVGVQGTTDLIPLGDTMEGRTNFLRKLVLTPNAWFSADKRVGIVPLTVKFTDLSFRSPTTWEWDFGDDAAGPPAAIDVSISVPSTFHGPVDDIDGDTIIKTYTSPGKYDVTLTVTNDFGTDSITIPEFIVARIQAPNEASIIVSPVKQWSDTLVSVDATSTGEQSGDVINEYIWDLGDDLFHNNSPTTLASYNVGGIYDVRLKVKTTLGAYRITTIENAVNIIEKTNLWHMSFLPTLDQGSFETPPSPPGYTKNAYSYEFGLISETFKTSARASLSVTRDYNFLNTSLPDYNYRKKVFRRNNSFAPRGNHAASALVYWAASASTIKFTEYNGFQDSWTTPLINGSSTMSRNWGWLGLNSFANSYILFGVSSLASDTNSNQQKELINLSSLTNAPSMLTSTNYKNGADELQNNPDGIAATYKGTWMGSNGYISRNDGSGSFFRMVGFYQTAGTNADQVSTITKLSDVPGTAKTELELTALSGGVYVFSNSGELSVYSPSGNIWATGGPGVNSASFKQLQDATIVGFDSLDQPLRVTSDGNSRAYLSFDYSPNVFIKFNETDLTFTNLGSRPPGEQFITGVF